MLKSRPRHVKQGTGSSPWWSHSSHVVCDQWWKDHQNYHHDPWNTPSCWCPASCRNATPQLRDVTPKHVNSQKMFEERKWSKSQTYRNRKGWSRSFEVRDLLEQWHVSGRTWQQQQHWCHKPITSSKCYNFTLTLQTRRVRWWAFACAWDTQQLTRNFEAQFLAVNRVVTSFNRTYPFNFQADGVKRWNESPYIF